MAFGGGNRKERRRVEREIGRRERRKLMRTPVIWGVLILFILINAFCVWTKEGTRREFAELHDVIVGNEKFSGENRSAENESVGNKGAGSAVKTETEIFYQTVAEEAEALYENLDMNKIKEQKLKLCRYDIGGRYRQFIDDNYARLQERVNQIREDGEASGGFYPGAYCYVHRFLYHDLFKLLILEMAVIMLLCVLFLMDYERICKTEAVVFATRTGRRLFRIKVRTGISQGLFFCALLLVSSLLCFFTKISFAGLWDVPIASALMAEPRAVFFYYPFITFYRLNVWQYLLLTIGVGMALVLIIGVIGAGIQMRINNSYLTFLVEAVVLLAVFVMSTNKTFTWLDILIDLNPANLWNECGAWFMENSPWMSFPGTEFIACALSGMLAVSVYLRGIAVNNAAAI